MTNTTPTTLGAQRVALMVQTHPVFLFIKGSPSFPQCGFSARAVALLRARGAAFESFDVLSDDDIRQGAKDHARWPTVPQLYVMGEFIGGSDIMSEMAESGELDALLLTAKG